MCGGPGCPMCGIVRLTEEQKEYYDTRKSTRRRLDLRGKQLHLIDDKGLIFEIEEGLLKWWADWQDQPDEIVVDSVLLVMDLLKVKNDFNTHPKWNSSVHWYKTKWSINPNTDLRIPIFENV